jgi:hypothetical protein
MKWGYAKHALTTYARTFDRSAVLLPKSHWFGRLLNVLVFWMSRERFMEHFATTVGPVVLIPDAWSTAEARDVIPHEAGGHVRQFRWCGLLIHPWAGLLFMGLIYGLLFFPIMFAYFRYRLELHAESVRWRVLLSEGRASPSDVMNRAQRFADTVSSWAYLKPWPAAWVKRGFVRKAKRIIEEHHAAR